MSIYPEEDKSAPIVNLVCMLDYNQLKALQSLVANRLRLLTAEEERQNALGWYQTDLMKFKDVMNANSN